eukprot:364393-Chlamydomonas_euryale.AAC.2
MRLGALLRGVEGAPWQRRGTNTGAGWMHFGVQERLMHSWLRLITSQPKKRVMSGCPTLLVPQHKPAGRSGFF